jgi:glycosyltransferase involved in cell wall biosynthesis
VERPYREKLSVLMPVYNEARTLRKIVARVLASPVGMEIELVAVDDCSTDASLGVLQGLASADPRIKVLRHRTNLGKGSAIQTAIGAMTGSIAVIQDADLEYDPDDYPALIAPILEGKADAVFGSRFAAAGQRKILLFWHTVANKLLTALANVLNDINLTDMETCYKAVRADILKATVLRSRRFGIEPELTTRLVQWNIRIYEVPVSYHGRTVAEGKKIGWRDAFEAVWCLFYYRFVDARFTTHDGYYILRSLSGARGFNRWVFDQFRGFVGDRVLEIGCGIGNFTELLLDRERLVAVDNDPLYVQILDRRFGHLENVRVVEMDVTDPEPYERLAGENIDTIICLNVIEHIGDDAALLERLYRLLRPGGHAIILVPCHPWLYSACDQALGHQRRYIRPELDAKLRASGFEVARVAEFNRFGVAGWYLNARLGRADLSPRQMKWFDRLLPVIKLFERAAVKAELPGLSLIAIGRKPAAAEPSVSRGPAVSVGAPST